MASRQIGQQDDAMVSLPPHSSSTSSLRLIFSARFGLEILVVFVVAEHKVR